MVFSLPPLKLTLRPTSGGRSTQLIQRTVSSSQSTPKELNQVEHHENSAVDAGGFINFTQDDLVEPTGHELETKSLISGWNAIRSNILNAVTGAAAMPLAQLCLHCEATASLRCQRCGPMGYFCPECFKKFHNIVNVFHVAQKWQVIIIIIATCNAMQCPPFIL